MRRRLAVRAAAIPTIALGFPATEFAIGGPIFGSPASLLRRPAVIAGPARTARDALVPADAAPWS